MKVIFDSDLLGDDFFALDALVDNEDIELLAVCSFGRITTALNRARMVQEFLEKKGKKGIAIVPGADRPLLQTPSKGCLYCNNELMCLLNGWSAEKKYSNPIIEDLSAAEYIASVLRKETDVTILSTGPMTNVALALSIAPDIAGNISNFVTMAGVHFLQGNKSPVSESNIFNDVDAAKIVLRSLKNVTMVPLDVTLKFCVSSDEVEELDSKFFRDVSLACCKSHLDRGDKSIMPMHDYLAYLALIDSDVLTYERCEVDVDNSGNRTRGMLLFKWCEDGPVKYAVNLDLKKCTEHYRKDFLEKKHERI